MKYAQCTDCTLLRPPSELSEGRCLDHLKCVEWRIEREHRVSEDSRAGFEEHLRETSAEVSTWPEWKKSQLK